MKHNVFMQIKINLPFCFDIEVNLLQKYFVRVILPFLKNSNNVLSNLRKTTIKALILKPQIIIKKCCKNSIIAPRMNCKKKRSHTHHKMYRQFACLYIFATH